MRKTRFVIIVFLMIGAMSIPGMVGDGFGPLTATAQDGEFTAGPQAGELGPTGDLSYVVLICQYAGDSSNGGTVAQVTELYTGTGVASVPTFFSDISYGQLDLSGSVFGGTFTLPAAKNEVDYGQDFISIANDCASEAEGTVTFGNFDGIIFLVNGDTVARGSSSEQLAMGSLGGDPYNISVIPESDWISARNAVREMAQSFGLLAVSAGPSTNAQTLAANPSPWDFINGWEFQNGNSVGSSLTDPTFGDLPQGMSARVLAEETGWIPDIHEETVEIGHARQIQLTKVNGVARGVDRFIRVPINVAGTAYYTVEVRKQEGYDANLPSQGVVIHKFDPAFNPLPRMQVVDPDGDLNLTNAVWGEGDVFTDSTLSNGGISIEILSDNGDNFDVYVTNQAAVPVPLPVTDLAVASNTATRDATQDNGFNYTIQLEWGDVSGVNRYDVYWLDDAPDAGEGNEQEWVIRFFGERPQPGQSTVSLENPDTGLTCATTYSYQVRSVTGQFNEVQSEWGNVASVTTLPCPGDSNGDGFYTPVDLVYIANRLGTNVDPSIDAEVIADATADGIFDQADLDFVLARLGTGDGLN